MIRHLAVSLLTFVVFASESLTASAQIPAFPGAEGFGAISVGGRGGDVYHVTSLDDTYTPGTLRYGLAFAPGAGRTIVFDISGNINLTDDLSVYSPNITIAGQTAPGEGITLSGASFWLQSNDLIVRHIRNRLGATHVAGEDSISIQNGDRVIMDHCTASWSTDEAASVTLDSTDNTIQWSLIIEPLNVNNHAASSLFRPGDNVPLSDPPADFNLTVHHSLYAHAKKRNPIFSTYNSHVLNVDFRNNVVFDWKDQATHDGDATANVHLNFVSNYYVAGLTTRADLVADPSILSLGTVNSVVYYNQDNLVDATRDDGLHNGIWDPTAINGTRTEVTTPFDYPTVATQSASDAYDSVLEFAGSFWWNRDPVDDRVITDVYEISDPDAAVRALSGMMITTEADVGGLPTLPVETRAADWDTDLDGMPDYWEVQHGLDPNTGGSAQYNGDFDADGYTNIEEYINDVGAFPAVQPIVFSAATNSRYAEITNWDIQWQPSRFDEAQIDSGTVVVDAVGQHAGTLVLGANPGDNATLSVTAGWLKVEDEVVIGADDGATASLTLSGGELSASLLSKGAGGSMSFTGGALHADGIDFDLVNDGGTLAPGNSTGSTLIDGDYDQLAGSTLEIEITSLADFDLVGVTGEADLAGVINVILDPSFTLGEDDTFDILVAGSLVDSGIALAAGGDNDLFRLETDTETGVVTLWAHLGVSGDYNDDGLVDAADYTVWRDALAAGGTDLPNDDTPGDVDESDYDIWKANFGMTSGSGAASNAAVPEPTSLTILLIGGVLIMLTGSKAGMRSTGSC
jgi:pectate lyase